MMTMDLHRYLKYLEDKAKTSDLQEMYLWPRTLNVKLNDFQAKIMERVGASDYERNNPKSRSYKVIKTLQNLINKNYINENFSLIDITCGDAVVLSELKKAFPKMEAFGVDCFKDKFETHTACYKQGIYIYMGYIQHMFKENPPKNFDCAIMFNTYRGWESADLREHEKDLPELADNYFKNNVKYTFLTATRDQIKQLIQKGFIINLIGKGEDNSLLFIMCNPTHTKAKPLPNNIFQRIRNFIFLNAGVRVKILGITITFPSKELPN